MNEIHSYPKIYTIGHKYILDLFDGTAYIQEKYDGSQLSWKWSNGGLYVKSKGKMQYGDGCDTDKMFWPAIKYLLTLDPWTFEGVVFRGEYLSKPKHNTLEYDRTPINGLVLYDVELPSGDTHMFGSLEKLSDYADILDIECAAWFGSFESANYQFIESLLETTSSLGGPKVEGVVVKNYDRFMFDGKTMMGKLVSTEFKEKHGVSWKAKNPTQSDIVQAIINDLNTEARFRKTVQALRDEGMLIGGPEDIGPLMRHIKEDTQLEEWDWIEYQLKKAFGDKIVRGIGRGLPEWYKQQLAEGAFDE